MCGVRQSRGLEAPKDSFALAPCCSMFLTPFVHLLLLLLLQLYSLAKVRVVRGGGSLCVAAS